MFKSSKNILICIIILFSNGVLALNASSYLISNTAIKLSDFEEAYNQYSNFDNEFSDKIETHLIKRMLTSVNLNLFMEAKKFSLEILELNDLNHEAWIVYLADSIIRNDLSIFKKYKQKLKKKDKPLVNYIFYTENNQIKKRNKVARSILEVVNASIINLEDNKNYNLLLFYLSICNFVDPSLNECYFLSDKIYEQLKNYKKAEKIYKKVKKESKLYIDSQRNIALNKSKLGLFEEGEIILLKLNNEYLLNNQIKIGLADLYRIAKQYKSSIQYYTEVLENQNNSSFDYSRVYYMRGISFERSQKWHLAEKDFLKSLEINPNAPQVLNYLAYGWLERNENIGLAIKMLNKAYKKNPESYHILDSLAWAYYKDKQIQKALELMEEVILMAPGEAISLDHLGDIYYSIKRKREAIFFWKQALDLANPEDNINENIKKKIGKSNAG
jgi:tetratricopeptide (TPR) repeat protein